MSSNKWTFGAAIIDAVGGVTAAIIDRVKPVDEPIIERVVTLELRLAHLTELHMSQQDAIVALKSALLETDEVKENNEKQA